MIIVDNELKRREEVGRPVRVGLIGAGAIGRGVAYQIEKCTPGMSVVIMANRSPEKAINALREAGAERIEEVSSTEALGDCVSRGVSAVTDDYKVVCESEEVDIIMEVTGDVDFGTEVALKSFACGKDFVTMNAEMDAVIGPVLAQRARQAGVIYSLSDGDQPGVTMNLWRYVKMMGLEPLVCGNIKGLQDRRRNPTTQKGFAEQWNQNIHMVTSFADGTKISFEQACVANATGMCVEQRGMRGGDFDGHIDELVRNDRYDVEQLRELGGVVDYVVGAKPAPGVFVFATTDSPYQRDEFRLYKMGEGPLYSFYTPYHLCFFEVASSLARVALFRDAVLTSVAPKVEVIARAKSDLKEGTILDGIGGYHLYGICENVSLARSEGFLPMGLAAGCRLKRAIRCDEEIHCVDVERPDERLCDRLRAEQDREFSDH